MLSVLLLNANVLALLLSVFVYTHIPLLGSLLHVVTVCSFPLHTTADRITQHWTPLLQQQQATQYMSSRLC